MNSPLSGCFSSEVTGNSFQQCLEPSTRYTCGFSALLVLGLCTQRSTIQVSAWLLLQMQVLAGKTFSFALKIFFSFPRMKF